MPLALPTPASEVPGNLITSTLWNANVYNGLTFAFNPPVFQGYQTATQSITTGGGSTAIAIDTSVLDTYAGHSNTTNNSRYTAQQSGYYLVIGSVGLGGNATGNRICQVNKNGTNVPLGIVVGLAPAAGNGTQLQCVALVQLNGTTDYVEVGVNQTSGSSLTTSGTGTGMTVIWVHA